MSRLGVALGLYAVLAAASWWMLDNTPISVGPFRVGMRALTLLILGLFVFRTLMHRYRQKLEQASAMEANAVIDAIGGEPLERQS